MKSRLSQSRGVSLISVIIAMLLLALLGSVMVSMVTNERFVGVNQAQAVSAQYLAEAGLDRALHYFFDEQQSCQSDTNVFNVTLGNGHYTVATELHAPSALTLTAAISGIDDQFTVSSDAIAAGYAPYGIVVIDAENVECAEVSGATFSHCKRGVGQSTPADHAANAKVYQEFCIVNATGTTTAALEGNTQRVVSVGFSQFDIGWAVGDQGTMIQWNGVEWLPATSPTQRNLRAVKLTSTDRGWIAGDSGVMGQLSGGNWTKQRSASIYLPATGGGELASFDTDPHEIGQSARVTYIPITGGGIREVAATPNGKYLYVTRGNPHNDVVVIDSAACLANPGACASLNAIAVGVNPRGLAVSSDGLRVYVANESGSLSVICRAGPLPCGSTETAPANDVIEETINFPNTTVNCTNSVPRYVALTSDSSKALVTTATSGCLKIVSLAGGIPHTSITDINLGDADQWGVATHPNNYYAYVAGRATQNVFEIDTVNNQLVEAIPVGGAPWHVTYTRDGVEAYVSKHDIDKVLSLTTATNTAGTNVTMPDPGPTGIAPSVDSTEMYVANVTNNRVNIIHLQDKTLGTAGTVNGLVAGSNIVASPDRSFRSISMLGPNEGWAVGDDGRLLYWNGAQWTAKPLVTMPAAPLPPNTVDNGDGTWTTTLEPTDDAYLRMNDDVDDSGNSCGSPLLGCTNGNAYGVTEPEWLKLRRVREDGANPNAVGDTNDSNNPNKELYRSYLKFDIGTIKQYALSLVTASLQLYAFHEDPASAASSTASSGLVLRYGYENDPGVAVNDSSLFTPANNGSRYGGTSYYGFGICTDCLSGFALTFDGVNGRVITPPSNSLKIGATTNRLTVETWVHFTDPADLAPGVVRELIRKGLPDSRLSYRLWVFGGKPVFSVKLVGHASPDSAISTDPTPLQVYQADGSTARWHHLVGTYDGTTVKIYQDGILKGQTAASGTIFSGAASGGGPPPPPPPPSTGECGGYQYYAGTTTRISADALCIGGAQGTNGNFKGWLDETRIYNAALTNEQVEEESGWGERAVDVYRADSLWTDGQLIPPGLSGNSQHNCASPGALSCTDIFAETLVSTEGLPKWLYWNVTRLVQTWVEDTYPNYGLVLRVGLKPLETDPSPKGILSFYSVDAVAPYTADHPRLIVTYRVSRRPNLTSVSMLDTNGDAVADDGWAVGQAGLIFRYNGSTWLLWDNVAAGGAILPTKGLNSISMRDGNEGWAVGDGGTMLHFTGGHWIASTPTSKDLTAVSIAANGRGIAVGKNGVVLSYDGAGWAVCQVSCPPTVDLTSVKAFSDAKAWGTGEEGTVIRKFAGTWVPPGEKSTTPAIGTTHLRGIDILPQQSTVTDWRENY